MKKKGIWNLPPCGDAGNACSGSAGTATIRGVSRKQQRRRYPDRARERRPSMVVFTGDELARWSRGTWETAPRDRLCGISHDTRELPPGAVYFALRGERFDGHEFVETAFGRGASAAVVARNTPFTFTSRRPLLYVEDPMEALQAIAAAYRRQLPAALIAVTGSAGKTTVKEMIADMLATAMPVARTRGNWNNAIGVPLSLLAMQRSDSAGVFEIGMNHPGELALLCQILLPAWGVITNVGPVHLEFFESVKAIAEEKAAVLRALPEDGVAVLNRDTPFYDVLAAAAPSRRITVSLQGKPEADYRCVSCTATPTGTTAIIEDRAARERHGIHVPLPGEHQVGNALLAVAVARGFGVEWSDIARALQRFTPQPMRWERCTLDGLTFINDAYNANPMSMRVALEAFAKLTTASRKYVLLGGMLELGRLQEHEHRELGRMAAQKSWSGILTVGELGKWIAAGARAAGFPPQRLEVCADTREAAEWLAATCGPGDMVLLKASRGIYLEHVIKWYRERMRTAQVTTSAANGG
jgi:UDP-N-acetylmuramoyl-tripeptide--D-alanyl-D-alanine ligase